LGSPKVLGDEAVFRTDGVPSREAEQADGLAGVEEPKVAMPTERRDVEEHAVGESGTRVRSPRAMPAASARAEALCLETRANTSAEDP
jgi:hypothetical protein